MTTFDKREEGFEKQFAHDEELNSRRLPGATSCSGCGRRRNSASPARRRTLTPSQSCMADFEEAGDHDVFRKIRKDFDAKNVEQSDHQIRRTMDELLAKAVTEIKAGT